MEAPTHGKMNANTLIGIILVIIGTAALVMKEVSYTSRETVLDLGMVRAEADMKKRAPISPVIGVAAIAGGVLMVMSGVRRNVRL